MDPLILVDARGKEIEKIKYLLPFMKNKHKMQHAISDFVLTKDEETLAVFERKTIKDFVSSLSKRMDKQALNMLPYAPASFLVLVGEEKDYKIVAKMKKKPFYEDDFYGALASIAVRYNLNILWVKDNKGAIKLIDKMCTKILEEKRFIPSVTKKNKAQLRVAALTFSWGMKPELAKKLMKRYGSICNILDADRKELKAMGVSNRTYRAMQEFFR